MPFSELLDAKPRGSGSENRWPGSLPLVVLERVDSTHRYARRILDRAAKSGGRLPRCAIAAWEQSAGRGRLGRSWVSRPGLGLYLTLVWPLPLQPPADRARTLQSLPLLAGVGLCQALGELTRAAPVPLAVGLKWPNDVLIAGRKVAGILIEVVSQPRASDDRKARERDDDATDEAAQGAVDYALIGLGVNHGHLGTELPTPLATSLARELGAEPPPLAALLCAVVGAVSDQLETLGELKEAVARYRLHLVHRDGDPIVCRMGTRHESGLFRGVDEQGHLRLETPAGEVLAIAAGEVLEPEKPPLEKEESSPGDFDADAAAGDGSAAQAYFRAIEDLFIELRGAPLLLSPADWQVARSWHRRGIPLAVVTRVLGELFERRRLRGAKGRVQSLRYCANAVESAWAEIESLAAPAATSVVAPLDSAARVTRLAAALPEDLPRLSEWRQKVLASLEAGQPARGAKRGALDEEAIEDALSKLDAALIDACFEALEPSAREEIASAVESSVEALSTQSREADLGLLRRRLQARRVREQCRLPVLSLFSSDV